MGNEYIAAPKLPQASEAQRRNELVPAIEFLRKNGMRVNQETVAARVRSVLLRVHKVDCALDHVKQDLQTFRRENPEEAAKFGLAPLRSAQLA